MSLFNAPGTSEKIALSERECFHRLLFHSLAQPQQQPMYGIPPQQQQQQQVPHQSANYNIALPGSR
jgi:hypothetical protein